MWGARKIPCALLRPWRGVCSENGGLPKWGNDPFHSCVIKKKYVWERKTFSSLTGFAMAHTILHSWGIIGRQVKGKAAHLSHGALKTSQAFICPSEGLKAPRNSVAFSLNAAFVASRKFHVVLFLRAFLLVLLSILFAKKGQFLQAALAALGNLQYVELLSYRDHCIFLVPCRRSE